MTENFLEFDAEFPDDTVWDAKGIPLVPGGKAIAEAIRAALVKKGLALSAVEQHSFYGWAFGAPVGNEILLQFPGPWLLTVERRPGFWNRLLGRADDRAPSALVEAVRDVIAADVRFRIVRSYSRQQYEVSRPHVRKIDSDA